MKMNFSDFTGQYKLSETLSFELKPIGKTAEILEKSGLLEQDKVRAGFYADVKKKLDDEHKKLLARAFGNIPHALATLSSNAKKKFTDILTADGQNINWMVLFASHKALGNGVNTDEHKKLQGVFRCLLVEILKLDELYNALTETTPKKFFAEIQKGKQETQESIAAFSRFACYFKGFQENRKNIYSTEPQATAAGNRLINENFPKFYSAVLIYQNIKENYNEIIASASQELAEQLAGRTLDSIFVPDYYNTLLAQPGIDDFNTILGGVTEKSGKKIRGINEFINLYRQQHPEVCDDRKLAPISPLFKQILSDRATISFVPEMFSDDASVLNAIQCYKKLLDDFSIDNQKMHVASALAGLLAKIKPTDSDIYIAADEISTISQKLLGNWSAINNAMSEYAEMQYKRKTDQKKYLARSFYALSEFSQLKISYLLPNGEPEERNIVDYWKNAEFFSALDNAATRIESLFNSALDIKLQENDVAIEKIKTYLDAIQELLHWIKPFNVENAPDPNANFYYDFNQIYSLLEQVIPLYNRVRNYVTQKAMETKKIKLMFGNPTLADGWDKNKESDNTAVIFRKDKMFYLGIMNPKERKIFQTSHPVESDEDVWGKMEYRQMADPSKDIPNLMVIDGKTVKKNGRKEKTGENAGENLVLEKLKNKYLPANINRIRVDGSYSVASKKYSRDDLTAYIDYYKARVKEYKSDFSFVFKPSCEYANFKDFTDDVSRQAYSVNFTPISWKYMQQLIDTGKLYLFQIYNRDFAEGAHGRPNKFTLYWNALFDPENLKNVVFKLNGEAELFLREPGLENTYTHRIGEKMVNRITRSGKPIPDAVFGELFDFVNHRRTGLSAPAAKLWDSGEVIVKDVKHEIIKDRRFTKRKYLFHVPITLNYQANDSAPAKFNQQVIEFLRDNPEIKIIGIDRGERNLIYLSLIDQSGKILRQESFNLIGNMDYHEKLAQRENERQEARKSWKSIGKIKDLKAGYLSQVVHEIATMMVQEKAIVVLENLNLGFKRGRFAIEKQVYQKFEKALIDKLNYLVFKNIEDWKSPGGVLNGYQLTSGFESFQKLGKQSGFLFYVNPSYTSKIDPTTGFANLFNLKKITNALSRQAFFKKFKSITFDAKRQRFAFEFCYSDFNSRVKCWKDDWTVYSADSRLCFDSVERKTKTVHPTHEIVEMLTSLGIKLSAGWDLKHYLCNLSLDNNRTVQCINRVFFAFDRSLQMRNSNADTGEDYIESPVLNRDGKFFRSTPGNELPQDADANGAYHIAMKGLYLLQQKFSQPEKLELNVETPDWLKFMQQRNQ